MFGLMKFGKLIIGFRKRGFGVSKTPEHRAVAQPTQSLLDTSLALRLTSPQAALPGPPWGQFIAQVFMGAPRVLLFLVVAGQFLLSAGGLSAQSPAGASALLNSKPALATSTLKIVLRLEDETPFLGSATVRVMPEAGDELLGMSAEAPGEFLFSGVSSGKYVAYVGAPGFAEFSLNFKIDDGPRQKSLFIPMKPKLNSLGPRSTSQGFEPILVEPVSGGPAASPAEKSAVSSGSDEPAESAEPFEPAASPGPPSAPAAVAAAGRDFWQPHELEESVPSVDPGVACPLDGVLRGVGDRMSEFVETLERFTAIEKLEHFTVDRNGNRKPPETRSFSYVVSVSRNRFGTFLIDEFRTAEKSHEAEFPAHTASRGSPAMALIFHPVLATDFDFRCEGLGHWANRDAWQVHFVQRPDHPIRIRSYSVDTRSVGLPLEGRAWIDPGNYQVLRLETELVKPLPEVALTREHFVIDYQPVRFRSTGQQLWLPQTAEMYVERKGKRFYRRHIYSDFMLFNVDATQHIRPPAESFTFTNSSDRDISGELTVERRDSNDGGPVVLRFTVPAHGKIFKLVGPGKDINLPVSIVGGATFVHEGDPAAIKVDTHLDRGASLDVVSTTKLPPLEQPASQPASQSPQP